MRQLLEERINELVLLQAALRDTTIVVPDERSTARCRKEIDQRQTALGGPVPSSAPSRRAA
jgi:hypothetical protein